jgi:hypothetical protein
MHKCDRNAVKPNCRLVSAMEVTMKVCLNCGAEVEESYEGLKHKRSRAFHCDLDDPDSLLAESAN